MRKNKKLRVGIFFGVVLTLALIVALVVNDGQLFVTTSQIVESVDMLDFISNNNDLNNAFFRIKASVGGGTDEIVGSVSETTLNDALGDRGISDFDLSFKADIIKEEAIYSIIPQSSSSGDFWEFDYQIIDDPLFGSAPPCTGDKIITDINYVGSDRFCIVAKVDDINLID